MEDILLVLTEKKKLLDTYSPIPSGIIQNLDEWFRIELTYTSNAIEGNTLTRQETAIIVEEGITIQGKSIQEHQEAINHSEAFHFIQKISADRSRKDITEQDLFDIHTMILHKINDTDGGRYRHVPVRLRGSQTVLPNPLKVPELMSEFIQWLHGIDSDHIVKIAADAHYKFVSIHPFIDGNGRTGRLLMNLILMTEGYPPAVIRKEDRAAYIDSLEKGQLGGSLEDYYRIVFEAVHCSLDIYLNTVQPEQISQVGLSPDKRFYTTHEVATLLQVDPESVRRYVRSGKLTAVKLGGKFIRIENKDLNEFIEGLKTK